MSERVMSRSRLVPSVGVMWLANGRSYRVEGGGGDLLLSTVGEEPIEIPRQGDKGSTAGRVFV
jgi:hypothetical protein